MNESQTLINELLEMSYTNFAPIGSDYRCVYLGKAKIRTREIGKKLYELGGNELMQLAARQIPKYDQLEINHVWHGIGEWLC